MTTESITKSQKKKIQKKSFGNPCTSFKSSIIFRLMDNRSFYSFLVSLSFIGNNFIKRRKNNLSFFSPPVVQFSNIIRKIIWGENQFGENNEKCYACFWEMGKWFPYNFTDVVLYRHTNKQTQFEANCSYHKLCVNIGKL